MITIVKSKRTLILIIFLNDNEHILKEMLFIL